MRRTDSRIEAHDGRLLFVRRYDSATVPASRSLLLVHGASEHGGRYEHVAEHFVTRGWRVVAADHRGHGLSAGTHTHVNSFDEYVHDLERVRRMFAHDSQRTAVLAHSMGSLIAIRHAQTFPDQFTSVAMSCPLLRVNVPIPTRTLVLGRVLSWLAPKTRFSSPVPDSEVVGNQHALAERNRDPLIRRSVTAKWYFAIQAALKTAWEQADNFRVPCFILQARHDSLVDPLAARPWLETVSADDTRLQMLDQHKHELLNESDWRQTVDRIHDWLDARVPLERELRPAA